MPDTIILVIRIDDPKTQTIIDKSFASKWTPSLNGVLFPPYRNLGAGGNFKCTLNPSKTERQKGLYLPRLTLYKQRVEGGHLYNLYIEFSAPKILYNNNLMESDGMDLLELCEKLSLILCARGVRLATEEIMRCQVKSIHYGKNIVLQNWMTPYQIINYASKADISLKKNIDTVRYLNGGRGLHIYTNEQGVCLYDKLEELKKAKLTEQNNMEVDSWCQLGLLRYIEDFVEQPFQVLRIESRLRTKNAIRQRFAKLKIEIPQNPTLEDLYREELGKAVLLNELEVLEKSTPTFSSCREPPEAFAESIRILNPKARARDVALAVGIMDIERNIGMRNARMLLGAKESSEWRDVKKRFEHLLMPPASIEYFAETRKQIESFKPLKLEDYLKK